VHGWVASMRLKLSTCVVLLTLFSACERELDICREESDFSATIFTQFRGGPAHNGVSPTGVSPNHKYQLRWKSEPMAIGHYLASKSSPSVDDDNVYVGMDDGVLRALNRRTGELVWSVATHSFYTEQERDGDTHFGIHGTPAVDDRYVYIGDYDGYLYAIDKQDGTLVWERKLGDSIGASPTIYEGYIYMAVEYATMDGRIFVVNAENGETRWKSPLLGAHAHSSVTIDRDNRLMFVGANNGKLYCFAMDTGTQRWVFAAEGAIKSTAAVADGAVFVTAFDMQLHAVSVDDGSALFTVQMDDVSLSSPAVFENSVVFGSHDSRLVSVDDSTGEIQWTFDTDAPILSSATIIADDGSIVFGSRDRHLYILYSDGRLFQKIEVASGISSVPAVVDNEIYLSDNNGTVYGFVSD
jgi:outer membrane protein assembly factor BamB